MKITSPLLKRDSLIILEDSIVKNLIPSKMSKSWNVNVKSFPGCQVEDVVHYVKPTMEKNSDRIAIHVETNDLKDSDPQMIAKSIISLANKIK